MIRLVRLIFVVAALCVAFFGGVVRAQDSAQPKKPPTATEAVVANWNDVGNRLVAMAEDWPEDKYDYKLEPTTRTFQEVILHVAGPNYDMLNKMTKSKLGDGRNDPAAADYKTKAATVAFLKKSIEDGAALAKMRGWLRCLSIGMGIRSIWASITGCWWLITGLVVEFRLSRGLRSR